MSSLGPTTEHHTDVDGKTFGWQTNAVNLSQLLRNAAVAHPNRIAVVQDDREISWAGLDSAADAAAAKLHDAGVRASEAVLLMSPNSLEQIAVMFGIWRLGAILTPVNFRSTSDEIAYIGATAKVRAVVWHTELEHVATQVLERLGGDIRGLQLSPGDEATPQNQEPFLDAQVGRDDPAWYFFSSGTTGRPKAAVLTHHGLGFIIANGLADLMPGTTEEDPSIILAPLSHGAATHLLRQVARSAPSVISTSRPMDPDEIWQLVDRWSVASMFVVPTILNRLVTHAAVNQYNHQSLKHVLYGGSPIAVSELDEARRVLGDVLVQYYGMAEVTGCITVLRSDEHVHLPVDEAGIASCGRVRTGMQVNIVDSEGQTVDAGQTGRICVAGPAVFAGYLDNETANAESFKNGWFYTGDIGHFDDRGFLYLTGRASDMFISGGSNVYPREIEEVLLEHPGVADVAVVGIPDEKWGEAGIAVCVAQQGFNLNIDELQRLVRTKLAGYKVPKEFKIMSELPKTTNDKTDKKLIRSRLLGAKEKQG